MIWPPFFMHLLILNCLVDSFTDLSHTHKYTNKAMHSAAYTISNNLNTRHIIIKF